MPARGSSEGLQAELESHRLRSFVRFAKRGPITDGELAVISAVLRAANLLTGDEAAAVASAQVRSGHVQALLFCLVMLRSRVMVLPMRRAAHVCHQSLLQHLLLAIIRIAVHKYSTGLGWGYSFILASHSHHSITLSFHRCSVVRPTEHLVRNVCCILYVGPQIINHKSTLQKHPLIHKPFPHACSWAVIM